MGADTDRMPPDGPLGHARARALAATSLDFPLTRGERAALVTHLETCAGCRGFADALLADAAELVALPGLDAPARVRDEVLHEVARHRPPTRGFLGFVLAALLVAALVEIALGVEGSVPRPTANAGPGPVAPAVSLVPAGLGHGIRAEGGPSAQDGPSVP